MDKWKKNLPIVLLTTFAAVLRLIHLGAHEPWYDEIFTLFSWDTHWMPPLYEQLVDIWKDFFPETAYSVRLLSVIFGTVSVALVYGLGVQLFNRRVAVLAAFMLAVSPFHLWYSQEARNYNLGVMMSLAASYFLCRWLTEQKSFYQAGYAMSAVGAMLSNYFTIPLVMAHGLYVVTLRRPLRWHKIVPFLFVTLLFSPHLKDFVQRLVIASHSFDWIPEPGLQSLIIPFENYLLGYNGNAWLYLAADIFMLGVFWYAMVFARQRFQDRSFKLVVFFFLVPQAMVYVFSKIAFSLYLNRGLIMYSPYFYLALAGVIFWVPRRLSQVCVGTLAVLMVFSAGRYYQDKITDQEILRVGAYPKRPAKPWVDYIMENLRPGDILTFTHKNVQIPFSFHERHGRYYFLYYPPITYDMTKDRIALSVRKILDKKFDRLWVVSADWALDGSMDENSRVVHAFLRQSLTLVEEREMEGVRIFVYRFDPKTERGQ